jgi:hypothetical protein
MSHTFDPFALIITTTATLIRASWCRLDLYAETAGSVVFPATLILPAATVSQTTR